MFIYVPVISLPNTEQSTELRRMSESFSRVIADNRCCLMNTTFTEKILYICIPIASVVGKYLSGSVAV